VSPPRRTAVPKHPGIYFRVGANGKRRYEITYTDSDGKRRWKVVDGSLQAAMTAREELRGRIRKGERVVPTRMTVAEVAEAWFASQANLRPRTRERYEMALRVHVLPRLGRARVSSLTVDDVAWLIGEMQKAGLAGWTIRGHLTPLSRVMAYAVRKGMAGANPVKLLDKGERPPVASSRKQVLERDEIAKLIAAAPARYRPLIATVAFTGLRISEALGLVWEDVDFEAGVVRVRRQLGRDGDRVEPKTEEAQRDVLLLPALARVLREAKLASNYSAAGDYVFSSQAGTPLQVRNVSRRGLEKAIEKAGISADGKRRIGWHLLRHGFGSMLLAQGENVVFVSGQLGHKDPKITLGIYAHEFNQAEQLGRARARLDAEHGTSLETALGDERLQAATAEGANLALLPRFATSGD
jgi:integrase